jgi:hypothetical protein
MLEMMILLPLALVALTVVGVFLLAAGVIWFLIELPFKLLGWFFGAIIFTVLLLPVVLLLAVGALAAAAVLVLPLLPLLLIAGGVWLIVRLVRSRRAPIVH